MSKVNGELFAPYAKVANVEDGQVTRKARRVNSIFQEREGAGVIYETCDAIWKCFNEKHMPFPTTEMLEKSANDYENLWNFPNCVAGIDGKHHMETGSFPFPQPRQIPGSTMTLPYVILGDQGYPLKKINQKENERET
nr:unnamed protein product [Callosobruchus chinensis]